MVEKKNWQNIKKTQNIMKMIVDKTIKVKLHIVLSVYVGMLIATGLVLNVTKKCYITAILAIFNNLIALIPDFSVLALIKVARVVNLKLVFTG